MREINNIISLMWQARKRGEYESLVIKFMSCRIESITGNFEKNPDRIQDLIVKGIKEFNSYLFFDKIMEWKEIDFGAWGGHALIIFYKLLLVRLQVDALTIFQKYHQILLDNLDNEYCRERIIDIINLLVVKGVLDDSYFLTNELIIMEKISQWDLPNPRPKHKDFLKFAFIERTFRYEEFEKDIVSNFRQIAKKRSDFLSGYMKLNDCIQQSKSINVEVLVAIIRKERIWHSYFIKAIFGRGIKFTSDWQLMTEATPDDFRLYSGIFTLEDFQEWNKRVIKSYILRIDGIEINFNYNDVEFVEHDYLTSHNQFFVIPQRPTYYWRFKLHQWIVPGTITRLRYKNLPYESVNEIIEETFNLKITGLSSFKTGQYFLCIPSEHWYIKNITNDMNFWYIQLQTIELFNSTDYTFPFIVKDNQNNDLMKDVIPSQNVASSFTIRSPPNSDRIICYLDHGDRSVDSCEQLFMPISVEKSSFEFLPYPDMRRKLNPSIQQFQEKFTRENGDRVFIMTRLRQHPVFLAIVEGIKEQLEHNGLQGFVASDCTFDDESVWTNVNVYMYGCEFGVAILEQILPKEPFLNPNVLLELGCMLGGLGKPCLVMKEKDLELPTDIVRIYEEFDGSSPLTAKMTVKAAIQNWIDKNLRPRGFLE